MQTSLTLEWADGSYDFKLTWAGCAEIERKSNAGIQAVYERVMLGGSYAADVVEIIRQGLLGGTGGIVDGEQVETKPAIINHLLDRYVTGADARPFTESWNVAKVVLHTYMVGHEPTQKKSEEPKTEEAPMKGSTRQRSSPTAPS